MAELALTRMMRLAALGAAVSLAASSAAADVAQEDDQPAAAEHHDAERFGFHAQITLIEQGLAGFPSPYSGENSLDARPAGRETANATLSAGLRPWRGAELWVDPEIGQGLALSDSRGVAGYIDGEAPRGGSPSVYMRVQRLFLRQTFDLGGESQTIDADADQLRGKHDSNRIELTLGKVAVGDIFDLNDYAHDSREDFLNASILSAGAFDYAANIDGYTYGAAVEYYRGDYTVRLGVFSLTTSDRADHLDTSFGQFQMIAELERRFSWAGRAGSLKLTVFDSRARMGDYASAVVEGLREGTAPDVASVARYRNRSGVSLNLQQQLSTAIGLFARVSFSDGHVQSYQIADIDRSISGGVVVAGSDWGRDDDSIGVAMATNNISSSFIAYLDHGGLGLAIGDGRLSNPGAEDILECFYTWAFSGAVQATVDYQFVDHPAYNRDRGPVSVFGVRLHAAL